MNKKVLTIGGIAIGAVVLSWLGYKYIKIDDIKKMFVKKEKTTDAEKPKETETK